MYRDDNSDAANLGEGEAFFFALFTRGKPPPHNFPPRSCLILILKNVVLDKGAELELDLDNFMVLEPFFFTLTAA